MNVIARILATDVTLQLSQTQTQMTEVIVSAGRTRETIDEVPSSVSIVGLKTLQQNINITYQPWAIFWRTGSGSCTQYRFKQQFRTNLTWA